MLVFSGYMEFHAFDDVLVLYYPPCPNGFIRVMRVCTHWELHTGVFGLDWSDPKTEGEAKAEYGLANEVIESEWFKQLGLPALRTVEAVEKGDGTITCSLFRCN